MKNKLQGWTLTEGMYDMLDTENPSVTAVITALEAIRPDVESPFIILAAPAFGDSDANYCQAFAKEGGYICEIRIFEGSDFIHYRAFLQDADGAVGEDDDPQLPNLTQTIQLFIGFIAKPDALPQADGVEWVDVSEQFDAVDD
jgi:hypothetical protein